MQIGLLVGGSTVFERRAEPAAVLGIAQRTAKGSNTVIHQRGAAGNTLRVGHGETVSHACSVHGFGGGTHHQTAVVIKAAETVLQLRSLGKGQQAIAFLGQPLMMGWRTQPTAEGLFVIVHDAEQPPSIDIPARWSSRPGAIMRARPVGGKRAQALSMSAFQTLKRATTWFRSAARRDSSWLEALI